MIIDPNVATVFYPIEIQFPSYTREEMFTILNERCRIGFYKDVINEDVIKSVTDRAYEVIDVRFGLKILTE